MDTHVGPAFPQPALNAINVPVRVAVPARLQACLMDATGRTVSVLAGVELSSGDHQLALPINSSVPARAYLLRVECGGLVDVQRILIQ